jgi:MFS family permease
VTTRRLALVGLIGPVLFAALVVLVTAIEWDFLHDLGWNAAPFASPDVPWPSSAALGDSGALLVLGFLALGASILALAGALFRLLGRRRRVGPALLVLLALGAVCTAFRTDYGSAGGGGPETWNGFVHALGFTILVVVSIPAMLVLGARFRRDKRWRQVAWYSFGAALIAVASLAGFLAGGGNLFFYAFLADVLAWLTLVAARALSLTSAGDAAAA